MMYLKKILAVGTTIGTSIDTRCWDGSTRPYGGQRGSCGVFFTPKDTNSTVFMPTEVLVHIIRHLDDASVVQFASTCVGIRSLGLVDEHVKCQKLELRLPLGGPLESLAANSILCAKQGFLTYLRGHVYIDDEGQRNVESIPLAEQIVSVLKDLGTKDRNLESADPLSQLKGYAAAAHFLIPTMSPDTLCKIQVLIEQELPLQGTEINFPGVYATYDDPTCFTLAECLFKLWLEADHRLIRQHKKTDEHMYNGAHVIRAAWVVRKLDSCRDYGRVIDFFNREITRASTLDVPKIVRYLGKCFLYDTAPYTTTVAAVNMVRLVGNALYEQPENSSRSLNNPAYVALKAFSKLDPVKKKKIDWRNDKLLMILSWAPDYDGSVPCIETEPRVRVL